LNIDEKTLGDLNLKANLIRKDTIQALGAANSGHPGGSLSCVELLVALYFKAMKIDPQNPRWDARDRFILSKGHACPALYSTLAKRGFFPTEKLHTLRKFGSILQGHPDANRVPGIDASTGSLGQGLSVANGMAMSGKLDNKDYFVYVLLGDGELEEGQVWEAAMTSAQYKVDNVIAFVDYNHLQIDGNILDVMGSEPIADKFKAFGWTVEEADGHDIQQILTAIEKAKQCKGPVVIILNTIKGKGVSFMENKYEWHGQKLSPEQVRIALAELEVQK
jgi:transketolase